MWWMSSSGLRHAAEARRSLARLVVARGREQAPAVVEAPHDTTARTLTAGGRGVGGAGEPAASERGEHFWLARPRTLCAFPVPGTLSARHARYMCHKGCMYPKLQPALLLCTRRHDLVIKMTSIFLTPPGPSARPANQTLPAGGGGPPLTRTPSAFFGSAHVLIWFGVVRHMYLPQSGAPVASTSPHQSAGKSKLWKLTCVV